MKAAPDLGDPAQQFLVHRENQEIVLRSTASEEAHVLVPHAEGALYQPELELVWFVGSCGPYLFDQTNTRFLVDHRLCSLEGGCKDVAGEALGWRVPGKSVGLPGTGDFAE